MRLSRGLDILFDNVVEDCGERDTGPARGREVRIIFGSQSSAGTHQIDIKLSPIAALFVFLPPAICPCQRLSLADSVEKSYRKGKYSRAGMRGDEGFVQRVSQCHAKLLDWYWRDDVANAKLRVCRGNIVYVR